MEAPNPNKRLRTVPSVSSSSTGQIQNPNPFPNVPDFNQNHVDLVISSFLSLPDLPSLSSPLSIGFSFDRALEKQLFKASVDDSVQDRLTDRLLQLAMLLQESTKRCYRKRVTLHNSSSWPLPHELTVKVFSKLDTKSLMQALPCCTMFNKCALEPLCYSHIDLTTGYVDDEVVHNMIRLADKELRSLKVGRIPCHDESTISMLSGNCLAPLSFNHGFIGNLLECLHLYNHSWLDNKFLHDALLDCSNLTDLKIVGLNFSPTEKILEFVPRKCEHMYVECEIIAVRANFTNVTQFARNYPNITSLSLIGFELQDSEASLLIESFGKLKYLDLSRTFGFDGSFLRTVKLRCRDTLLENLILRDCISLEKGPVLQFWDSLLEGNFRFIQHVDISNFAGLIAGGGSRQYCTPKFCLDKLKEKRPGLTFVADFT